MNQFIVIEGPDGSGKSTLSKLLAESLHARGISVSLFREPGATSLGERLRDIIADKDMNINPRAETLLFCAARAELADKIRNSLQNSWVILDRYEGSTLVYQGIVRQLGKNEVQKISRWASNNLQPDATLVLLLDAETSRRRRSNRTEDRMETTTSSEQVTEGYRWLAEQKDHYPISANGTPEEALQASLQALGLEE